MTDRDLRPFETDVGAQRRRYATATDADLEELERSFPKVFVEHVKAHGWCSMAHDAFWTVSPSYLAPALADWGFDASVQAFARSAFGEVFAQCQGKVVNLYSTGRFIVVPLDVVDYLNHWVAPSNLRKSEVIARKKELGPIAWDECYTYTPAFPIETDGPREPGKGKLIPYVSIIGQLVAPVKIARSVELT